jgi:hypothetical protein
MKKVFTLLILFLSLFNLSVNAYSIQNVFDNTTKYETEFSKKINFTKIKIITLKKLLTKIDLLVKSTE